MIHGKTLFDEWWKQFKEHYPTMRFLAEQAYYLGLRHAQEHSLNGSITKVWDTPEEDIAWKDL